MSNQNKIDDECNLTKFNRVVQVVDEEGQPLSPTYLRRARGLVKKGRADWFDDKTIRMHPSADQGEPHEMEIRKYRLCCQNTAQNYWAHIIPVPDDFDVDPACLHGIDKIAFIFGLKKLTAIVKSIYQDMIQNPAEYGLPLVEDIPYEKSNPKALESKNSVHRLISIMYCLVHSAALTSGTLIVDRIKFQNMCRSQRTIYKIVHSEKIFQKLCAFHFCIAGFDGKKFDHRMDSFTVSYPDERVIHALYGYMQHTDLYDFAILPLNYFLCLPAENLRDRDLSVLFADYFTGDDRAFFIQLNEYMSEKGFYCRFDSAAKYTLGYYKSPKGKQYFMRCYSENGRLQVCFKLDHVDQYISFVEKMPETVKQMFRREQDCSVRLAGGCEYKDLEHCSFRRQWTFEGQVYQICNYGSSFQVAYHDPVDVPYYKQIVSLELGAE